VSSIDDQEYKYRAAPEIIKEFPGGVVALRWTCGDCQEDTVTVFERGADEKIAECQFCQTLTSVARP
jgi:hypothetical protein